MRISMPHPVQIGATYYLRVRVPKDLAKIAKNTQVVLPIGDRLVTVKVGAALKASLQTKDAAEAKHRFAQAYAAVEAHWDSLRAGPQRLSHKDVVALAGELREVFINASDADPGDPSAWERVIEADNAARDGRFHPYASLVVGTSNIEWDMEQRFGDLTDATLRRRGLVVDSATRKRLINHVADALADASRVNLAKANGDYSDSGETTRYPVFSGASVVEDAQPKVAKLAFDDVIDAEVEVRQRGRGTARMKPETERKFRIAASEFAVHRGSDDLRTVTAREVEDWKVSLLEAEKLSLNTVKQRLQNLKTVVEWARVNSLGEVFPDRNPLEMIKLPKPEISSSANKAFRIEEARALLNATRLEDKVERRWLPWLCAYSGARVNEVSPLRQKDFFQVGEDWFCRITTKGGRSIKNEFGFRNVPLHPDVLQEGLLDFVFAPGRDPAERLFPKRSAQNLSDWVRGPLKMIRAELMPNHGWRHLFEDLAMEAGMSDSAKAYITGRSKGSSSEGYGKSDVMLPGLAREIRKIQGILG